MTPSSQPNTAPHAAIVLGASGGIGGAIAALLDRDSRCTVHRLGRAGPVCCDLADPASLRAAAATCLAGPPISRVFLASGLLHDGAMQPEKSLRALDADWLLRQFTVNSIGPALFLGALLPALPRDRPVRVAVLGARVGSIADNRLGGWYGYRASKAALHQFVRTAAIEWRRTHPDAVLAALHPGTVATPLSAPFRPAGGVNGPISADESAQRLLGVLDGLTPEQSGRLFDLDGHEIAP